QAGALTAVDATTGEVRGKVHLDYFNRAGVLATAGDWVMTGEFDGEIRAFNADTLEEVWHFNVGSSIKGPAVTYEVDGIQYVAILVGAAPGANEIANNVALEFFSPAHTMYVFKLDDDVLQGG